MLVIRARMLLILVFIGSVLPSLSCKPRDKSDVKDLGHLDLEHSAVIGGGRNSFYGKPMSLCIYSSFPTDDPKYATGLAAGGKVDKGYFETVLKPNCTALGGWTDGLGICLKTAVSEQKVQGFEGSLQMYDNLSQLASSLDIDLSAKLRLSGLSSAFGEFSLSPTARFFSTANETEHNTYFAVRIKLADASANIQNPAILPARLNPIKDAIERKDAAAMKLGIARFLDACGDEYSHTINYGGEFIGIMSIATSESSKKTQEFAALESAFGARVYGVGAQASASASIENLRAALQRMQNVKVWFTQTGGNPDGIVLQGVLDGLSGYQSLIASAQNFIRMFSNSAATAAAGSASVFTDVQAALAARPDGSRGRDDKTQTPDLPDVPQKPMPPPVVNPDPTVANGGMSLTGAEGDIHPPAGAVRNANFWAYTKLDEVRELFEPMPSSKSQYPNLYVEMVRRRDRLANYLAKFEKIKANKLLLDKVDPKTLTKNQLGPYKKYQIVFEKWISVMKMADDKNCVWLGSGCEVPEETPELKKLMDDNPSIVLTDFKLPTAIPDVVPSTGKVEPPLTWVFAIKPDIENENKHYADQGAQPGDLSRKYILKQETYLSGMRQCPSGRRYPKADEFNRMAKVGFTSEADAYRPRNLELEYAPNEYTYDCYWRYDPSVTKNSVIMPAWGINPMNGGSHLFVADENKKCFVVCVNDK